MTDNRIVHPSCHRLQKTIVSKPEDVAESVTVIVKTGTHYLGYSITASVSAGKIVFFLGVIHQGPGGVELFYQVEIKNDVSLVTGVVCDI